MIDRCVRNGVTCPCCQDRLRSHHYGFICKLCGASGNRSGKAARWDYIRAPNASAEDEAAYRLGGVEAVYALRSAA